MAQRKTERLTPLELEIMQVLWETGAANVQTVQQRLKRELAYTTVQTMLNILHDAGKDGLPFSDWNEKAKNQGIGTKRQCKPL